MEQAPQMTEPKTTLPVFTRHETCRHWDDAHDLCVEFNAMMPRERCVGCKQYETNARGLGDAMEQFINFATVGQAKRIAGKIAGDGGCGCSRRRAAMNRLGNKLMPGKEG
jgi:hypothetical protein